MRSSDWCPNCTKILVRRPTRKTPLRIWTSFGAGSSFNAPAFESIARSAGAHRNAQTINPRNRFFIAILKIENGTAGTELILYSLWEAETRKTHSLIQVLTPVGRFSLGRLVPTFQSWRTRGRPVLKSIDTPVTKQRPLCSRHRAFC